MLNLFYPIFLDTGSAERSYDIAKMSYFGIFLLLSWNCNQIYWKKYIMHW